MSHGMKYKYWLANMAKSDSALVRRLTENFKSAERIYEVSASELIAAGFNIEEIDLIERHRTGWNVDEKWAEFQSLNINLVTTEDKDFPTPVRDLADCPYAIYYIGTLPEDYSRNIAIVGARKSSGYGKWATEELSYQLAARGYNIVSGMALGIDGSAHYGCLKAKGYTMAVLGCGPDICYPAANRPLYEQIAKSGCIISEYPPHTNPLPVLFPQRNRIISALSQKVIVMEARRKSGSLITADFALEQGRDLYALPGRINDPLSEGTNYLLYQGASPIWSIDGFLRDVDELDDCSKKYARLHAAEKFNLEKEETLVYSYFDFYPVGVESVIEKSGLPFMTVYLAVEKLSGLGLIKECFHNQYIRTQ